MSEQVRKISLEELHENNGADGKPIYVAYRNKVYDVSSSKLWRGGKHMNRHNGGEELSAEFQQAPHKSDVLQRFPLVGVLDAQVDITAGPERKLPAIVHQFPFLKRHPHPMTVHFPIVFSISVTLFSLLYLLTGWQGFDEAALCCLGASVLFTPLGILTGLYTWWLNYYAQTTLPITIKLVLSPTLFVLTLALFIWRVQVPDVLDAGTVLYILLVLALMPLVGIIGWYGASLTFPIHEDE